MSPQVNPVFGITLEEHIKALKEQESQVRSELEKEIKALQREPGEALSLKHPLIFYLMIPMH